MITKFQHSLTPPRIHYDEFLDYLLDQLETKYLNSSASWLTCPVPTESQEQILLKANYMGRLIAQRGCPGNWMEETHRLNCEGVWSFDTPDVFKKSFVVERDIVAEFWAKAYGVVEIEEHEQTVGEYFDVDLSEGDYWQWVLEEDIVPKMLIRGGVRLAGVLNSIFTD